VVFTEGLTSEPGGTEFVPGGGDACNQGRNNFSLIREWGKEKETSEERVKARYNRRRGFYSWR